MLGDFDSGEVEDGCGEVDELDHALDPGAGLGGGEVLPVFGNVNDHGNLKAIVVGVALAAGEDAAVVAVVEDEGVIEEAVGFELCDDLTDLGVG